MGRRSWISSLTHFVHLRLSLFYLRGLNLNLEGLHNWLHCWELLCRVSGTCNFKIKRLVISVSTCAFVLFDNVPNNLLSPASPLVFSPHPEEKKETLCANLQMRFCRLAPGKQMSWFQLSQHARWFYDTPPLLSPSLFLYPPHSLSSLDIFPHDYK